MMPGVLRFPAEISILKKEVFNNWYKLRTYYIATLITSTPIHVNIDIILEIIRNHSYLLFLLTDTFRTRVCNCCIFLNRTATRAGTILKSNVGLYFVYNNGRWIWNYAWHTC